MSGVWKLQDAKARFSELVREARKGQPQRVSVHGKESVVVVDPERFEIKPREPSSETMADFFKRARKYRAKTPADELRYERRLEASARPLPFGEDTE